MKIDICIPTLNEEKIIVDAVRLVKKVLSTIADTSFSIIVADNGSTDETVVRAKTLAGVSVLSVPVRGKGAAVVGAARSSSADVFGFIDADLSADPSNILKLLAPISRNECDIVIGSRLIDSNTVKRQWLRTILSRLFNLFRKTVLGVRVQDTQCGLKLMNRRGREVLVQCKEIGWFFDIEFLARAEKMGLRIVEVPVNWDEYRFKGRKSKLNMIRDGFAALIAFVRIYRRTVSK